jgi:ribosomal-protein-alanine N-acetyltransferase
MDTQAFSLRPATSEDLDLIAKIESQVHVAPWTREHFSSELLKPYSQFLVLTDDESDSIVAGYIVFWFMFEECQILNIVVDTPYRGLGFAKRMLRKAALLASQKGVKGVTLEVRKSNLPAIQLYQGLQFVITQIRKGFYSNGEDAYHMKLSLVEDPIQF